MLRDSSVQVSSVQVRNAWKSFPCSVDGVTESGTDNVQRHRDVVSVLYVRKHILVGLNLDASHDVEMSSALDISGKQLREIALWTLPV